MDGNANGQAIQAEVKVRLNMLSQAIGDYLVKKMPARVTIKDFTPHEYADKSYDSKSDSLIIDKSNIASVKFTTVERSQGFLITFKTLVTFTYTTAGEAPHTRQLSIARVQLGDIADGAAAVIPVNDKLVQAGYNYFVVYSDGSYGIHNPGFVADVLNTSLQALK